MTDKTVKALCAKLDKFYWSPREPHHYGLAVGMGLGNVASMDYGAFNVVWALTDSLKSQQEHFMAISAFKRVSKLLQQTVEDSTLSEWCTLLTPDELSVFIEKHKDKIDFKTYQTLAGASLSAIQKLSRV